MKKRTIIIFLSIWVIFGGCYLWAKNENQFQPDTTDGWRKKILEQIRKSQGRVKIFKKVSREDSVEVKIYKPEKNGLQLEDELQHAFKFSASEKKIKSYYTSSIKRLEEQSEIIHEYTLNSLNDSKSNLKYQKIITTANQTISYTESVIQSKTWLYNSQINIRVWFDSSGTYAKHDFAYQNSLFGDQMNYKVKIEANRE